MLMFLCSYPVSSQWILHWFCAFLVWSQGLREQSHQTLCRVGATARLVLSEGVNLFKTCCGAKDKDWCEFNGPCHTMSNLFLILIWLWQHCASKYSELLETTEAPKWESIWLACFAGWLLNPFCLIWESAACSRWRKWACVSVGCRRKRGEKGEVVETIEDVIVRRLTAERIEELKKLINETQEAHRFSGATANVLFDVVKKIP